MGALAHSARCSRIRARGGFARGGRAGHSQRLGCPLALASSGPASELKPATPVVHIDNIHDPFSTIVDVEFGDYLGELLDTVAALKNLDLSIVRAKVRGGDSSNGHRFFVTDSKSGDKITKSDRIEDIRLTVLKNMIAFHPEAEEYLALGTMLKKPALKTKRNPLGPRTPSAIPTRISVQEDPATSGLRSVLYLECADRPGLVVDVVKVLSDLSVSVVSAEIDTEGLTAKDLFYITYRDEALNAPMVTLVQNALSYYLTLAEVETEESY